MFTQPQCPIATATRRQFLRNCSMIAIAASLTPTAVLAQRRGGPRGAPDQLVFEQFVQELNTSFSLRAGSRTSRLLLVEAHRLPVTAANSEDARNERFSLLFRGPAHPPLAQDTFLFEHPRIGPLAIFIVPTVCTEDATHCYYEAVFNYPVRPADLVAQLSRAPQRTRSS
jgi:hypothetical protein